MLRGGINISRYNILSTILQLTVSLSYSMHCVYVISACICVIALGKHVVSSSVHGVPKQRGRVGAKLHYAVYVTHTDVLLYITCTVVTAVLENHQETKHVQEALPDCLLELPVYVCFLDYRHVT